MGRGIRLRAYLMRTGEFKRASDVIELVESGKVLVSGKLVTNPEHHIKQTDLVQIKDGKILKLRSFVYIIFNKPIGFVCQKSDEEKSIYDLIEKIPELEKETKKTLFSVGRLDRDTEGLLIVTNDGKLANKILRPEKHIQKTYLVETEKIITGQNIKKLQDGVTISEGGYFVKALKVNLISSKKAQMVIDEGKKRQIRLMFEAIGKREIGLKRIAISNLKLESLDFKGKNYIITTKELLEGRI